MKNISFAVLLALCLATVFNSCKPKKEDPKPDPKPVETPTKTSLLTNKKWVMNACVVTPVMVVSYEGQQFPVSNLFDPLILGVTKGCFTDDEFEFKALETKALSGEFFRKSNNQCDNEPDQTGTWAFNSDQTQIVASTQGGTKTTFNIVELTDKMLKVTMTLMNPLDDKDTKVYTANATLSPK